MKRILHRCGCCDVLYDPAYAKRRAGATRCHSCGCWEYEEVYEDDVE